MGKGWKAKALSKEIIEGGATRKYAMLWRYVA